MPRSDRVRDDGLRDAGGSRRADRAAILIGAAVAAVLLAATLWLSHAVFQAHHQRLTSAAQEAAQTLAEALADDLATAAGYGIPLEKMRGVEDYLNDLLGAQSLLASITILSAEERPLFHTGGVFADQTVRAPILVNGGAVGTVVAEPSFRIAQMARSRHRAAAVALSLVTGILVAIFLRIVAMERLNLPKARLTASAAAAARGVLADFTPPPPGPLARDGEWGARVLAPLRRHNRSIAVLTEEVRALDTAAELDGEIRSALAPLDRFVFDRPRRSAEPRFAPLWWALLALSLLFAARPLVASFALDRVGPGEIAPAAIAAAVSSNTLGLMAGLVLALATPLRGAKSVSALGLMLAGIALAATYLIRDPLNFTAAQFAAGLFGAWAVASSLCIDGALRRAPWRGALLLVAALAVATPLGSLLSEALGRRMAFLVIGIACVLAAFLAFTGPAWKRRRTGLTRTRRTASAPGTSFALATISAAIVAYCEIALAADTMRENYAGLAALLALMGAVSFLPFALPPAVSAVRGRWQAPGAAVLATAAVVVALVGVPPAVVVVLLGIAMGLGVAAAGVDLFARGPLTAILCGALLAAASELIASRLGVPSLVVTALSAASVSAISLGLRLRGR